jgi:hypothetical protein
MVATNIDTRKPMSYINGILVIPEVCKSGIHSVVSLDSGSKDYRNDEIAKTLYMR